MRVYSSSANILDIVAPTIRFNAIAADTDVVTNYVGTTSSGVLTWMEDEDYFKFADDLYLDKKIVGYNNVATAGYGVPAILYHAGLVDQAADINATNITNTNVAGTYRISYYFYVKTTDIVDPSELIFYWLDNSGGRTETATMDHSDYFMYSNVIYVQHTASAGAYITFRVTNSGTGYGDSTYDLYFDVERLS
jgi:hypothetical protein